MTTRKETTPKFKEQELPDTSSHSHESGVVPAIDTLNLPETQHLSSLPPEYVPIHPDTIRSMIHDANQHITAILGGAEIAQIKHAQQQNPSEILTIIKQSAIRLSTLLSAFGKQAIPPSSPVTRPETAENQFAPINITEILHCQIKPRQNLYPNIQFEIDAPPDLMVSGDIDDIHRILENMFVNARRSLEEAAPINPRISVSVRTDKFHAHIMMEDNGTGIPEEIRKNIFRKGFSTKTAEGHGVGLYYSKIRARSINGDLKLYDNSEIPDRLGGPSGHRGAAAVFTLPLAETASL